MRLKNRTHEAFAISHLLPAELGKIINTKFLLLNQDVVRRGVTLYLNPSRDGHELLTECEEFINYYNQRRSHSSLGRVAPAKVYKQAA